MKAKWSGKCKGCGRSFSAGTEITFYGRGNAYHAVCPKDVSGPERDDEYDRVRDEWLLNYGAPYTRPWRSGS